MKRILTLTLALLLFLTPALAEEAAPTLITREALLEIFQPDDPSYIDGFIADYQITPDYAAAANLPWLYNLYTQRRVAEKNDYFYLIVDAPEKLHVGGLEPEKIAKVLWFWNPNSSVVVRLYDLAAKVLYYGDYNILHDISRAENRALTDEEIAAVHAALADNDVMAWEPNYASTVDDSTGWLFWQLSLVYEDGSVFQSSGSGSTADHLPPTYSAVRDALQK